MQLNLNLEDTAHHPFQSSDACYIHVIISEIQVLGKTSLSVLLAKRSLDSRNNRSSPTTQVFPSLPNVLALAIQWAHVMKICFWTYKCFRIVLFTFHFQKCWHSAKTEIRYQGSWVDQVVFYHGEANIRCKGNSYDQQVLNSSWTQQRPAILSCYDPQEILNGLLGEILCID